jgi:hypothetical protein
MVAVASTQSLEVVLGGAKATSDCPFSATGVNSTDASVYANNGTTNGVTAVTIIAAPASGYRLLKSLLVYNADTAAVAITVRIKQSSTYYTLCSISLASGYLLQYAPESGFTTIDASGKGSGGGGGSGTVSSVGLALPAEVTVTNSPVTGTGTLTGAWANATQNHVFAGPATGGAGTPAFRALVSADLPGASVPILKPSDQTANGSPITTLINDADLKVAVAISSVYFIEVIFRFEPSGGGIKFGFTGPSAFTSLMWNAESYSHLSSFYTTFAGGPSADWGSSGRDVIRVYMFLATDSSHAGTVQLQWANNSTGTGGTVVKGGSIMRAYKA